MADDTAMRRELRMMLQANGVSDARAAMVVDLAVHASDSGFAKVSDVIKTAPDGSAGMMALEIALQLLRARCDASFERAREYGASLGLPQYQAAIAVMA